MDRRSVRRPGKITWAFSSRELKKTDISSALKLQHRLYMINSKYSVPYHIHVMQEKVFIIIFVYINIAHDSRVIEAFIFNLSIFTFLGSNELVRDWKTRGPRALKFNCISKTVHRLLVRKAHICISAGSFSRNKVKSTMEEDRCIITP